jgi:hypothetical protein
VGHDKRRRAPGDRKDARINVKVLRALRDVLADLAAEEGITQARWMEKKIIEAARVRGDIYYDRRRGVWIERRTGRQVTQTRR